MIIIAPNDRDWNAIAERTGDDSWRAESMQGYFTRIEKCLYRSIYQGFFRGILGFIYDGARWFVGRINPLAVFDLGGHGDHGWQPTSFLNTDLVGRVIKRNLCFRRVQID